MSLPDAALAWYDAGFCVLPAAKDNNKRPLSTWVEWQQNRPPREQIERWFRDGQQDGMGLITGFNELEMFELEGRAVAEGMHEQLVHLLAEADPALLAKVMTYVEKTPSGGLHWLYRVDGPIPGSTPLARRQVPKTEKDPTGIKILIETRGKPAWTITAPSAGRTHPTGGAWTTIAGQPGMVATLTSDEHATLHRIARTFDEMPELPAPTDPRPPIDRKPGELTPGDDYALRTDWADILVPAGWVRVGHRGEITYWRRPGKNVGISATTGYGDMGLDLFYVFTTSTEFESNCSYSKLGAYATLHHHGDYAAAAGELRRKGYGTPQSPQERVNPLTLIQGDGEGVTEAGTLSQEAGAPAEEPPSWQPVDLSEYLDGSFVPQVPELMVRGDGQQLLYRSRVHSFHGESESGKSWMALAAAAPELIAGRNVIMIDFESDPHTTVGRLLRLGVPQQAIQEHFCYVRPEVAPTALAAEFLAWQELLFAQAEIAIIDGVTEALAIFGITSKDNDEVTGWIRSTPRKLAQETGAAVILVDHVTKDADTRGRFAIGGQAKMAALDGAAYVIEVIEPLGVGLVGRVAMRVAKDRPGGVRPHSGPYRKSDRTQESAVVTIDSTQTGVTTVSVGSPREEVADENGEKRPFKPTALMERVSRALELANACMSRTALKASVHGRNEYVLQAIDCLVEDEFVVEDGPSLKGGKPTCRLVRPYRENPSHDLDPSDLVPTPLSPTCPRPGVTTPEQGDGFSETFDPSPGTGRGRVGDGFSQPPLEGLDDPGKGAAE